MNYCESEHGHHEQTKKYKKKKTHDDKIVPEWGQKKYHECDEVKNKCLPEVVSLLTDEDTINKRSKKLNPLSSEELVELLHLTKGS